MKSNEDLGELMDSEKAKVNQFYSGEKLIERITESMDPVKYAE